MISVFEVVVDPDMLAPQPFAVLRSTGQFVAGGFASTTTTIPMFGPVQQATDKEVAMLPEADRVSAVRSFWSTQPIYETRGYAPVPGVHGELLNVSGLDYALSSAPPGSEANVYANGLLLRPNGVDYLLTGASLVFNLVPAAPLYVTWDVTVNVQAAASDEIQYDAEVYRILRVYRDPGSGYWKAYGTRMRAA
jgi:hypothetical protein